MDGHGGWIPQPVISPANNEQVDEVLCAGVLDAEAAATAARDRTWASLTAERRAELLHAWSGAVAAAREELAELIAADSGKPIRQARGEAEASAAAIRYFAGAADKPSGAHPPQVLSGWALVFREPIGTVAAITPWNAPAFAPAHKTAARWPPGTTWSSSPLRWRHAPHCSLVGSP